MYTTCIFNKTPPEEEEIEECSSKMDLDVSTYYRRLSRGVKTKLCGDVSRIRLITLLGAL